MSSSGADPAARAREELGYSRWWLIVAAAGAMGVISPYQYVWSSIEGPLATDFGVEPAVLAPIFTVFVILQAGSQFPVGWWRDRHGPRRITTLAALLAGGGYVGLAYATAVWQLYLCYALGAVGVGIVYTVAVNTALKWFPDRRGLTTGIGTMAFAGGSALFVPYVRANETVGSYSEVLRNMGILIGLLVLVAALVIRDPPTDWQMEDEDDDEQTASRPHQFTWRETLRTWQFWMMYAMFIAVSGAGLMVTAQVVSFAEATNLAERIQLLGTSIDTATLSATVLPIAAGVGRLVMGEFSDRFERRRMMAVSFLLCGVGIAGLVYAARASAPTLFVASVVLAVFFWSPQYTLFPSIIGEYYGMTHSSSNYALLYSGKMWGGVFGGALVAWLVTRTGWYAAFGLGGSLALVAGLAALLLRPPSAPHE
ncbi:MAG: OFA family MFS transporter [Halobacteriales archaeon]|nr:OFA family MFS transporter [Halobacteriales archaeon]